MSTIQECFDILGIPKTLDINKIRKAYIGKAKILHPDKNKEDANASEKFQALANAYEKINYYIQNGIHDNNDESFVNTEESKKREKYDEEENAKYKKKEHYEEDEEYMLNEKYLLASILLDELKNIKHNYKYSDIFILSNDEIRDLIKYIRNKNTNNGTFRSNTNTNSFKYNTNTNNGTFRSNTNTNSFKYNTNTNNGTFRFNANTNPDSFKYNTNTNNAQFIYK